MVEWIGWKKTIEREEKRPISRWKAAADAGFGGAVEARTASCGAAREGHGKWAALF